MYGAINSFMEPYALKAACCSLRSPGSLIVISQLVSVIIQNATERVPTVMALTPPHTHHQPQTLLNLSSSARLVKNESFANDFKKELCACV